MKKNLNPTAIANELKGGSAFFQNKTPSLPVTSPLPDQLPVPHQETGIPAHDAIPAAIPRYRDTTVVTTTPRAKESIEETTRKAVKQFGKEAATYRFTVEEKKALSDVVYTYQQRGVRTSGNEITRIGLNYLLEDYHRRGEQSILAQIIELLNG